MDFAKRWELIVSNPMFVKRSMQRITYSSGGNNTQVDEEYEGSVGYKSDNGRERS